MSGFRGNDLKAIRVADAQGDIEMLARIHGSRLAFERRKINGEVWLPASANHSFNARVALLKMLRRDATLEFSNYRKFTVDTSSSFAAPTQ
jgi:hypothetical protein